MQINWDELRKKEWKRRRLIEWRWRERKTRGTDRQKKREIMHIFSGSFILSFRLILKHGEKERERGKVFFLWCSRGPTTITRLWQPYQGGASSAISLSGTWYGQPCWCGGNVKQEMKPIWKTGTTRDSSFPGRQPQEIWGLMWKLHYLTTLLVWRRTSSQPVMKPHLSKQRAIYNSLAAWLKSQKRRGKKNKLGKCVTLCI